MADYGRKAAILLCKNQFRHKFKTKFVIQPKALFVKTASKERQICVFLDPTNKLNNGSAKSLSYNPNTKQRTQLKMPRNSQPQLLPLVAAVTAALCAQVAHARAPETEWLNIASADVRTPPQTDSHTTTPRSVAQNNSQPAYLDQWTSTLADPGTKPDDAPAIGYAYTIEGSPETEITLSGDAELRRAGTVIKGETIVYTQQTGEVQIKGDAQVSRAGVQLNAPEATYQLDDSTGGAENVDYEYKPRGLRGKARCMRFASADVTELKDVLLTSCEGDNPAWWVEMDEMTLDEYEQSGTGTGAVLKLGGMPVLGSPWFTFPLSAERKSGFLSPVIGMSSARGLDISVPYYFNIAPNYDYTLTPQIITKRGVMIGNEFRFLNKHLEGEITGEYMPHDNDYGDKRYSLHANIRGSWNNFGYGINYNRVSDDEFFDDFSTSLRDNTDDILPQDYWLNYSSTYWNAAVRVTKNQTINDTDKPYEREPQFSWNAFVADAAGFELTTHLEATRFVHPTEIDGDRFVFHQQIAYPIRGAGWFVTPKAQLISTKYDLDHDRSDRYTDSSPGYTVPMFSIDSGLTFERDLNVASRDMLQTLEPRLFYSYTPYRNQSQIPLFDSSVADLNFAQLYSENTWAGYDRIAETNQMTASVTSRFIDANSGLEWIQASIGQRYYFNDRTVNSEGERISMENQKSDFLASVGARLTRTVSASLFGQWSWERSSFKKAVAGVRWQPKPQSVIGLYYRYNWQEDRNSEDYIDQIDLAVQWPLSDKVYALLRQNYSLYDHKFIESLAGVEYHAGCWTLRAVAQRYTRDEDKNDETNFFLQLELTGLGAVGSSPLSELQRSIPGYQTRSPVPTSIGTYDYYQ